MRHLRWLIIPAVLILGSIVTRGNDFLHAIYFYSIFAFSWFCFAAFVGLALSLLLWTRTLSVIPFVLGAISVVISIVFSFINQHTYAVVGFGNISQSIFTIVIFGACWLLAKRLPHFWARLARPISMSVIITGLFWFLLSPPQFFLPVLFIPDATLSVARIIFAAFFCSAVFVTVFFCARTTTKHNA